MKGGGSKDEEGRKEGKRRYIRKGRQEGRKEGRREGRSEGRMEGRKEGDCYSLSLLPHCSRDFAPILSTPRILYIEIYRDRER